MSQFNTETSGPVLQYRLLEGVFLGETGVYMGLLGRSPWEKEGFKWGCLQSDSLSVLHKHRQLERHLAFEIVQIASFIT